MGKRIQKLRKIRLHHEGVHTLVLLFLMLFFMNLSLALLHAPWHVVAILSAVLFAMVTNFFRCPLRTFEGEEEGTVVAPADGRVVVIEEVEETELFHDRRLMVSIFMNIFDVHANWLPVNGTVRLVRHVDGNYHVAWLPKASIENEHSLVVIDTPEGHEVLVRQVAGAMARRVVTYVQEGESYEIDEHMGFIKFGSRVDLFLPLGTDVKVSLGQHTVGNETVIAKLPSV